MQIGDKIKTFEIKNIVKGYKNIYTNSGRKTKIITNYYLLEKEDGQQRVLESGKTNLNDCEVYCTTWNTKFKFKRWNQFEIIK